jgi:O-antigen/teichoic acid export membrane protein
MAINTHAAASSALTPAWRRMLNSGIWVAMESLLSRGTIILAMMYAASAMGSTGFGQLSAVQTTVIMLASLIADALRITGARQISAQKPEAVAEIGRIVALVFTAALGTGAILGFGTYLISPWIATALLSDAALSTPLRIGSILLFCEALNGLCMGVLIGLLKFRAMATCGAITGTCMLLLVGFGAHRGVTGMLWALTVTSALGVIVRGGYILRTLAHAKARLHIKLLRSDLYTLLHVSLPGLLTGACFAPVNWLITLMLIQSPNGYQELGLIGIATQWFSLLLFLPNVVGTLLLPQLSQAFGRSDVQELRAALQLGIRSTLLVSIPAICIITAMSSFIMSSYGSSYAGGGLVLALYALAAGAGALQNLFTNLFASVEKMWDSLSTQITWGIAYVVTTYFMLRFEFGATGVGVALVVAYLVKLVHAGFRARNVLSELI